MKTMRILFSMMIVIGSNSAACEFTIFNDHQAGHKMIYVAFDEKLSNVVSKETLKAEVKDKKAISVKQHAAGTTPFTKFFDIYVPRKEDGQYERAFRVNMNYCGEENDMTVSQIKNKQISMKRFKVADFSKHEEAKTAHTLVHDHGTDYIHEHSVMPQVEANHATDQEPMVNPLGDKILIP